MLGEYILNEEPKVKSIPLYVIFFFLERLYCLLYVQKLHKKLYLKVLENNNNPKSGLILLNLYFFISFTLSLEWEEERSSRRCSRNNKGKAILSLYF
jgi:hypothetical protein